MQNDTAGNGETRLLTTREVAKRLRLAVGTIENWRYLGKGPKWIRVGGAVRYPAEQLRAWLAAGGQG